MTGPPRIRSGEGRLTGLDRRFLARAVQLGRGGWGRVHPNPMVGAVVARGETVLGEARHEEFGGPHAEAAALAALGERARGGTLYTSLEPCSHTGKTPPCTEAIRAAGVARVVFWAAENPVFFHRFANGGPFLALKLAVSLDGCIAPGGGRRVWLTGTEARAEVHRLRAGFEAVLVGTRTWKADDPVLTARGAVTPRVPPVPVLLDRRGQATAGLRALNGDGGVRPIVAAAPGAAGRLERRLAGRAEVLAVGVARGGLDLAALLEGLGERGVGSVLCEGGGVLGASLLAERLVDRIYLFVAPVVIGAGGVPAFPLRRSGGPDARVPLFEGWQARLDPVRFGSDTLIVLDRGG